MGEGAGGRVKEGLDEGALWDGSGVHGTPDDGCNEPGSNNAFTLLTNNLFVNII
jgi:hypothetical protein